MSSSAISFLPLGALLQTLPIGSKNTNIVLGFPAQADYEKHNDPHFGLNIGRYANRIANGKIETLNGKSYSLEQNNATNTLHGGSKGWGRVIWDGPSPIGLREIPGIEAEGWSAIEGGESVKFTYRSPDGDNGFPGTVDGTIVYTSGKQKNAEGKEATVLAIEYEATLVDDESGVEETVLNLTNHSYFNLNPSAEYLNNEGTTVTLADDVHLPLDDIGVPIDYKPAKFPGINAGEPFTFTRTRPVVDDNFLVKAHVNGPWKLDTRGEKLEVHVTASNAVTGLNLQVLSTEPSYQFYTGVFIDVPEITSANGEKVPARNKAAGFCVEPSRFVNAVNIKEWRDQVVLKKGGVYGSRIVYRGWEN